MPAHPDTYAIFYDRVPEDKVETEVWVELKIKGNRNTSISKPVTDQLKNDYPFAWDSYKNNSFELCDGTPLRALPGMSPSQAAELNAVGVSSVEGLSELTDAVVDAMKGGRTLRTRANAYLAAVNVKDEPIEQTVVKKKVSKKKAAKKVKTKVK